jgi:hypothetical protein
MSKVRRFYYIAAPKGAVVHRSESHIAGAIMFCGRTTRKGWLYYAGLRHVFFKGRAMCAGCS